MATSRSGSKKKYGLGIVGGLFALGLIGSFGSHDTDTSRTSSAPPATSWRAAPPGESTSLVGTTPQSPSRVAPPAPARVLAMSSPAGGNVASPVFGQQITATAP